jgi:hypothetical protein
VSCDGKEAEEREHILNKRTFATASKGNEKGLSQEQLATQLAGFEGEVRG